MCFQAAKKGFSWLWAGKLEPVWLSKHYPTRTYQSVPNPLTNRDFLAKILIGLRLLKWWVSFFFFLIEKKYSDSENKSHTSSMVCIQKLHHLIWWKVFNFFSSAKCLSWNWIKLNIWALLWRKKKVALVLFSPHLVSVQKTNANRLELSTNDIQLLFKPFFVRPFECLYMSN